MKKVLVLYYSQTGQLKNIVDSVTKPLMNNKNIELTFSNYTPVEDYNFPWTSETFYDAFPESVNGISCKMKPLDCNINEHYDLIILAYQVWYLSPAIPVWSILSDEKYKTLFNGKKVVTLLGVRNMWVMAHQKLSNKLKELGSNHVGNIVLTDPYPNLVSVVTVIKWMLTGNQGPYKVFPRSGVKLETIEGATIYGDILGDAILNDNFKGLQERLISKKAVKMSFALKITEQSGIRIFGIWSKFILKKGGPGNIARRGRTKLFSYYLMTLIFLISPISSTLFRIINLLFYPIIQKKLKRIALMR